MNTKRGELIKQVIELSNRLNSEDRTLSSVVYCVASVLRNGGDIFAQIEELKDQISLAKHLETVFSESQS